MGAKRLSQEKIDRILQLAAQGLNRDEIAKEAGVSTGSVSYHLSKPSTLTRVPVDKIREACQQLTSTLEGLKMFQNQGENKENSGKEEKMSNGDVQGKVQEALDRKEMLEKLGKVEQVAKDVEALKNQGGKVPELLIQKMDKFEGRLETIDKRTEDLCSKQPELCNKQDRLAEGLEELKKFNVKKSQGILGTEHPTVEEFKDCPECQEIIQKYASPQTKTRFIGEWCKDPECQAEMEKAGLRVQKRTEGGGMLGSGYETVE